MSNVISILRPKGSNKESEDDKALKRISTGLNVLDAVLSDMASDGVLPKMPLSDEEMERLRKENNKKVMRIYRLKNKDK